MNEKVDELEGQASKSPPFTQLSEEQLQDILENHRKWVESGGKEGQRAALGSVNLWQAMLGGANLQAADLSNANLEEAFLGGANLLLANLEKANLQGANLEGANLGWAELQGANLGWARGLNAPQVKTAKNWELAIYSDDFLKKLGLKPNHNEMVNKRLAEEKKATGAKP